MTVKLAILKSGENIISDIKEGFLKDKLVCYILENPCEIKINGTYKVLDQENNENQYSVSLSRWPSLSKDTTIELIPDHIVTLVDPIDSIQKLYESKVLHINNEENKNDQNIVFDEQSNSDQSD